MIELERLRKAGEDLHSRCFSSERAQRREYRLWMIALEATVRADELAKYLADSGGRNQTHATGAGYRDE